MSKAPKAIAAIARKTARDSADLARVAIVLACAGALILAGEALPFAL
jgi:hypothetical protein